MRNLVLIGILLCGAVAHAGMDLGPNDRVHVSPDGEHFVILADGKAVLVHRDAPDTPLWTVKDFPDSGVVAWPGSPGSTMVTERRGLDGAKTMYHNILFPTQATNLLLIGHDVRFGVRIRKWYGEQDNHYEVIFIGDRSPVTLDAGRDLEYGRGTSSLLPYYLPRGWRADGEFSPWAQLHDDDRLRLYITRKDGTAEMFEYDLLAARLLRHDVTKPSFRERTRRWWNAYGTYGLLGVIGLLVLAHLFRRRTPRGADRRDLAV
jgi:hypothetical protein